MSQHRGPGRPRTGICPPASDKVMLALDEAGQPLSPPELQGRSGLKRRTLYFALHCLEGLQLFRVGVSLRDARRRRYVISEGLRGGRWRHRLHPDQEPPTSSRHD